MLTACCGLLANNGFGQTQQAPKEKSEEIIIKKNSEAPQKMTIVIDSNDITVNGKPLSAFNGDVTIMRRNLGNGNNGFFQFSPGTMNVFNAPNKAFLGVLTAKTDKGAVVKNVIEESAAKDAGLRNDDIITKFGDTKITSPDDLRTAVGEHKPGDKVTIEYLRDGKNKTATVELGKRSPSSMNYNMDSLRSMLGNSFNFRMPRQFFDFNFNNNSPKLGLQITDTPDGNGAKVSEVVPGSPAEKAGLEKGDVITQINGEKVTGVNDVTSEIMHADNKNDFKIRAMRDKKEMNFEVTIPKQLKSVKI